MNSDFATKITTLIQNGQVEQAKDACIERLDKMPSDAQSNYFLGAIFYQKKELDKAINHIRQAIQSQTDIIEYQIFLANILAESESFEEAISTLLHSLKKWPDNITILQKLGSVYIRVKQFDDAESMFSEILSIDPASTNGYIGLAEIAKTLGDNDQAILYLNKLISLQPNYVEAHAEIAGIYANTGNYESAITNYTKAISLRPKWSLLHFNIANVYRLQELYTDAIKHYEIAIKLRPDYLDSYYNLGLTYLDLGDIEKAETIYLDATEVNPDNPDTLTKLAGIYKDKYDHHNAIKYFRKAMLSEQFSNQSFSNYLLSLNYIHNTSLDEIATEHFAFAARYESPLIQHWHTHDNDRINNRKLNIGYVSADFVNHSVAFFIEPILNNHDSQKFEIFCYENRSDDYSNADQAYPTVNHWRSVADLSDAALAKLIREDHIDILVDLSGHTAHNRLTMFAHKPAPVQVTWLGYPNTTGLTAMDYRFVDATTDPKTINNQYYSEKLIQLPNIFSCFKPNRVSPDVATLPTINNGYITFGSFNTMAKQSPQVLKLWIEILQAVPNSKLMLKAAEFKYPAIIEKIGNFFAVNGIDEKRILIIKKDKNTRTHLNRYNQIDIALDPFPYCGTTTNCDAFWMGVPVITLAGNSHASRVTASQLENINLHELIASSPSEYVKIAVKLANNPGYLAKLRKNLRQKMTDSSLCDAIVFTKNLEQAYTDMWKIWCKTLDKAQSP